MRRLLNKYWDYEIVRVTRIPGTGLWCSWSTFQVNVELSQPLPAPASQLQTYPDNGRQKVWCLHTLTGNGWMQGCGSQAGHIFFMSLLDYVLVNVSHSFLVGDWYSSVALNIIFRYFVPVVQNYAVYNVNKRECNDLQITEALFWIDNSTMSMQNVYIWRFCCV